MINNPALSYVFLIGMLANLVLPSVFLLGKNIYPSFYASAFLLFIWLLIFNKLKKISVVKSMSYVLLILLTMFLSYAYTFLFLNSEVSSSKFANELLRYIPFLPFILMFNYINVTDQQISRSIFLLYCILATVATMQLLGVEKAVRLYAYESHIDTSLDGFRLVLTGSNPNVGSIIAAFFLMYFITGFFINKSYKDLALSITALSLIFLTQGRTTIIGTSIVIVIYAFLIYKVNIFFKLFTILILIGLFTFTQQFFDLSYLYGGIETLSTGDNNSINIRHSNAQYALQNLITSPIFGWSTFIESFGEVRNTDSEIFLILQRYGIFGFLVFSFITFKLVSVGFKFRKRRLGLFLLLMMLSLIFNMLTNAVFLGIQTSSIIVFLMYLAYLLECSKHNTNKLK